MSVLRISLGSLPPEFLDVSFEVSILAYRGSLVRAISMNRGETAEVELEPGAYRVVASSRSGNSIEAKATVLADESCELCIEYEPESAGESQLSTGVSVVLAAVAVVILIFAERIATTMAQLTVGIISFVADLPSYGKRLIVLSLIAGGFAIALQLVRRQHSTWVGVGAVRVRWIAIADTVIVAAAILVIMHADVRIGVAFMIMGALWALLLVWNHSGKGVDVGIRHLLEFYMSVSLVDALRLRLSFHKFDPTCPAPPTGPPRMFLGDTPAKSTALVMLSVFVASIVYVLLVVPAVMLTFILKASAVPLWPLLYIGVAADTREYEQLALQVRRQYRSSFKTLSLLLAGAAIVFFAIKMVIFSVWNRIAEVWNSSEVLRFVGGPVAPATILPWHVTSLVNGILTIILLWVVDGLMHDFDDRGLSAEGASTRLRCAGVGFRLRTVLSCYNWYCLLYLSMPVLRDIDFPPITWRIVPE